MRAVDSTTEPASRSALRDDSLPPSPAASAPAFSRTLGRALSSAEHPVRSDELRRHPEHDDGDHRRRGGGVESGNDRAPTHADRSRSRGRERGNARPPANANREVDAVAQPERSAIDHRRDVAVPSVAVPAAGAGDAKRDHAEATPRDTHGDRDAEDAVSGATEGAGTANATAATTRLDASPPVPAAIATLSVDAKSAAPVATATMGGADRHDHAPDAIATPERHSRVAAADARREAGPIASGDTIAATAPAKPDLRPQRARIAASARAAAAGDASDPSHAEPASAPTTMRTGDASDKSDGAPPASADVDAAAHASTGQVEGTARPTRTNTRSPIDETSVRPTSSARTAVSSDVPGGGSAGAHADTAGGGKHAHPRVAAADASAKLVHADDAVGASRHHDVDHAAALGATRTVADARVVAHGATTQRDASVHLEQPRRADVTPVDAGAPSADSTTGTSAPLDGALGALDRLGATPNTGPAGASDVAAAATRVESARWADHVADSLRLATIRDGAEMRVRLDPPGLGHIDLRISLQRDGVHATIVAEHETTRSLLSAQQHLLHAALERSDIRLAGFSVDVGSNPFGAGAQRDAEAGEPGGAAAAQASARALPDPESPRGGVQAAAASGLLSVRV